MKKRLVAALSLLIAAMMTTSLTAIAADGIKLTLVDKLDSSITAVSPAEGATVTLANDVLLDFSEKYSKTNQSASDAYWTGADIYMPNNVTLKWTDKSANYYIVRISQNGDMSDSESYVVTSPELVLKSLYTGTTYYWQVEVVTASGRKESKIFSFTTADTTRAVFIEGVSNTRDAGGKLAADGYRMKQGMFYRGGKVEGITEAGKEYAIRELGIKTELDIRNPAESTELSFFVDDVKHIRVNGPYSGNCFNESYKEALLTEIKTFADPDNYPIYAHCSIGRDRTGTITMLIQGLLGVDEYTRWRDYEMSLLSAAGGNGFGDHRTAMTNFCNDLEANYDGDTFAEDVELFMLELGVTAEEIASIRNILLEEVE